jgi:hypothetical protein
VETQSSCELRATSNASWLDPSPSVRNGSGVFRLEISENRGSTPRMGTVTLTGSAFKATVVVVQKEDSRRGDRDDDDDDDDDDDEDGD